MTRGEIKMKKRVFLIGCTMIRRGSGYQRLRETLERIKKADENICGSFGGVRHDYVSMTSRSYTAIYIMYRGDELDRNDGLDEIREMRTLAGTIFFVDLSIHGYEILEEMKRVREFSPTTVFVLYTDEIEYKRCKSELPGEWAQDFDHYYKVYKSEDSNFDLSVRHVLDDARLTAERKKLTWADEMPMDKVKVLAIFANPKGSSSLRLGAEDRVIHECLSLGKYREKVMLHVIHAATIHDVRRALLQEDYDIIQFSGHGTGKGLAFETRLGEGHLIPQEAFATFISAYSPPVRCAILNACYSREQGRLLSPRVPYTIVTDAPISDEGAIEFTRGFYDAIAAGKNIQFAYQEGCRTMKLMGHPASEVPLLLRDKLINADMA